jgi:hypothetical protein|tara:strand:- start:479 stop:718 length:240 start_codon:yes stop_codon:yes gene_type:complete
MITINNKEYDEAKLSDKAKVAVNQLQVLRTRKAQLTLEYQNQDILQKHYSLMLEDELKQEEKKVNPKEAKVELNQEEIK